MQSKQNPRKARRPRILKTRPVLAKLDPRLSFILSVPARELKALKEAEDQHLHQLSEQAIGKPSGPASDAKLRESRARRFAPITAGIYFPKPSRREKPFPVNLREPYASVFILSDASAADLAKLGVKVRSQSGDIFTAFVPLSRITKLAASPAIRFVELARPLVPMLDQAVPYAQIDGLHNAQPSINGSGVVVGIVDVYLDIYHPDFRTAAGATRVLYLWDQALTPQGNEKGPDPTLLSPMPWGGATYGVEYDQTAIDTELSTFNPPGTPAYRTVRHGGAVEAHGTHVAGIAAGNGLGQAGRYVGAAPAANIIFVRPLPTASMLGSDSAATADAFAYTFARADQLQQPCVVNMSISEYSGPRDGTMMLEKFLDSLLGTPGRAITLCAGNDNDSGETKSHATGTVPQGGTATLGLRYGAQAINSDVIEIWYSGQDSFDVQVTVEDQSQGILPTVIGPITPGTAATAMLPGNFAVDVTSVLHDPRNNDNLITIIVTVPPQHVMPTIFSVDLIGRVVVNGTFHAWLSANNQQAGGWGPPFGTTNAWTLGTPGTAHRPITVGDHDKTGPPPTIMFDSGCGPTRDGRVKPEIATVGIWVTAPRSRNMNDPNPGPLYVAKYGTSMSAPLVGGACALLFQCRGASATWSDLKNVLQGTAGTQGLTVPDNAFGFGYMQMGQACVPPPTGVDVWLRDSVSDTGVEPFVGSPVCFSPDIEVLDTAGNPVPNPTYNPNAPFNNIVRVTARNRGLQPALNTEVYLYWADPATYIPITVWNSTGFFINGPQFVTPGNKIVVPQIAAAGSTPVEFAWAPPQPGSNLLKDNHFCLIARLENVSDPSNIGPGGWSVIAGSNNVALRNVLVQQSPPEMNFYVVGTADEDSLIIYGTLVGGRVELRLPAQALPWRDIRLIEKHGRRRLPYGCGDPVDDPLGQVKKTLEGSEVRMRTDIVGAESIDLERGVATIIATANATVVLPSVHLAEGAKMPVNLRVGDARIDERRRLVHVAQLSGGRRVGGVSLQLTEQRGRKSSKR